VGYNIIKDAEKIAEFKKLFSEVKDKSGKPMSDVYEEWLRGRS